MYLLCKRSKCKRIVETSGAGVPLTPEEETQIKIIDDDLLWYDLETLLDEKQETEKPKLHIDLDYTVRPFKVVEEEYLEIFKMFHVKH